VIVGCFEGGPFQENAYLVACEETRRAVAVDPGGAASQLVRSVAEDGLELVAVLLTHAHLDHVDGIPEVRHFAPDVPIHLHPADRPLYDAAPQQAQAFGLVAPALPAPDREIVVGETLEFSPELRFEVRFASGHAPGHVVFVAPGEGLALVGDVVFAGSIGRTDLPGGDFGTLMRSIREEILTLPDDTRLLPGHGPQTTVGRERTSNPFLTGAITG
jgi:glyoxylase-like metal-dependent hydrolase (beta-lactamase superfamily II)